tara:strand:- start:340 stop:1245 length:906 start_codon:yes stop_codon:yes gene_type:complete
MATDKEVRMYFENLTYGNDSLSTEIHGKRVQQQWNNQIASHARLYAKAIQEGDKATAGHHKTIIHEHAKNADNLKAIKEEFARNIGGGQGGRDLFSNWTNKDFEKDWFTERGDIEFSQDLKPLLTLTTTGIDGKPIKTVKRIEDLTPEWVIRGSEEQDFMTLQQSAVKQRNTQNVPLDFDIDWEISKLLKTDDKWKIFFADEIGGRKFLPDWIEENSDDIQAGNIPDEKLHPESFNPEFDNRLHLHFANRLRRAFDPNYDTNRVENTPTKKEEPKRDLLNLKLRARGLTSTHDINKKNTKV